MAVPPSTSGLSQSSNPAWGQLAIPKLRPDQRIEDWSLLFSAAVCGLVSSGADGEKFAIGLLPGYLNRSTGECELVSEVVKTETKLKDALDVLQTLDPPIDKLKAMQQLCRHDWKPGTVVDDYFYELKRLARYAGDQASFQFICNLFVTQMPPAVQTKANDFMQTLQPLDSFPKARQVLCKVKEIFVEKSIALDKGCRDFDRVAQLSLADSSVGDEGAIGGGGAGAVNAVRGFYNYQQSAGRRPWGRFNGRGGGSIRGGGRPVSRGGPVHQALAPSLACFVCESKEHLVRDCTLRRCQRCGQRGHDTKQCSSSVKRVAVSQTWDEESSVSIPMLIEGCAVTGLVDTGAGISVVDRITAASWGVSGRLSPPSGKVFAVGNVEMAIDGVVDLRVDVGDGQVIDHKFTVLSTEEPTVILGRQFLRSFPATEFDWNQNRLRLGDFWKASELSLSGGDSWFSRNRAARINVESCSPDAEPFDVNPALGESQKERVLSLLDEYKDVFAVNPKKPSLTNLATHVVETSGQPIKQKMFRMSPSVAEEVDRQVVEMLHNGICRPSMSPWSSRVILVRKKDGSMRFVVDYRALNDQTKKDAYPMPQISDIVDRMHGSRFFSVTDGASAYWSVGLEESSREKTAFSVPRGHFEMNVMSFGMSNANASYQRVHDMALQRATNSAAYVDDACTFSGSFEEHLVHIRTILQCYRSANLQLKRSKCKFAYEEVDFAGFRLCSSGLLPVPENVAAVVNFPTPTNLKQVQRFVAMANYYRNFLPAMSRVAAPLHELSKQSVPFRWSDVEQSSFEQIKSALTNPPVLGFIDWGKELFLETDASKCAVGAILSQRDHSGRLKPLGYFSSGLTDAQKNYSATELECWALVAATRKWHVYVQAAPSVILLCDHNPLVWIRKQKDARGKFGRWLNELEGVSYEIRYRQGKDNIGPDCLSRAPCPVDAAVNDESSFESTVYRVVGKPDLLEKIVVAIGSDEMLQKVLRQLQCGDVNEFEGYSLDGDHLVFGKRLVIPQAMVREVIQMVHGEKHLSTESTLRDVAKLYSFKGMSAAVDAICKCCAICQHAKRSQKLKEPMQEYQLCKWEPRYAVAMDIATLPWADGHRYFLLIVDLFARFVELVPLRNQSAESICGAFRYGWVLKHGIPSVLVSDQGKNVDGDAIRQLCDELNIQKRHSSPYHPEGDGLAERMIQTVKSVMRCMLAEKNLDQKKWPSLLAEVAFVINSKENASTKFAPQQLFYGKTLRSPIEASLSLEDATTPVTPAEFSRALTVQQTRDVQSARANHTRASAKRKAAYDNDRGTEASGIDVGDLVLLKNPRRESGLDDPFDGPFVVSQRRGPNVEIEFTDQHGKTARKWVHLNRCKPFRQDGSVDADSIFPAVIFPTRHDIFPPDDGRSVSPVHELAEPFEETRKSIRDRCPPVRFGLDDYIY
jgi:transposase InsO family protein